MTNPKFRLGVFVGVSDYCIWGVNKGVYKMKNCAIL